MFFAFCAQLVALRDRLGVGNGVGIIVADAADPASLAAMAGQGNVVLANAGPFSLFGEPVVAACIASGTDYIDITGAGGGEGRGGEGRGGVWGSPLFCCSSLSSSVPNFPPCDRMASTELPSVRKPHLLGRRPATVVPPPTPLSYMYAHRRGNLGR